jgi:predicted RNA-binding protein YlxR (DUF448 family)
VKAVMTKRRLERLMTPRQPTPERSQSRARKEKEATRKCIVTGTEAPRETLLRFVLDPENQIIADVDGRLPGRGFWLSPDRDVVNTAVAKRAFSRAARAAVTVPEDLADRVCALLASRCRDKIGLARRAGQAVSGFEKVSAELRSRRCGALLLASDAQPGGKAKTRALAGDDDAVVELLTTAELGLAFGSDAVVHVFIAPGGLAKDIRDIARKLAGFRTTETNETLKAFD